MRGECGSISLSKASRFPAMSSAIIATPVMLPTGSAETVDEPALHGVYRDKCHDDRDRRCCPFRRLDSRRPHAGDPVDTPPNQFDSERREPVDLTGRKPSFDQKILVLGVTEFAQSMPARLQDRRRRLQI